MAGKQCLYLLLSVIAAFHAQTAASAASERVTCSLLLKGFSSKAGIKQAQLSCDPSPTPVQLGINKTYLGQFASSFTGVELTDRPCEVAAPVVADFLSNPDESPITNITVYPLLCFFGSEKLLFDQPAISDVKLKYQSTDTKGYTTAVLVGHPVCCCPGFLAASGVCTCIEDSGGCVQQPHAWHYRHAQHPSTSQC